MSNMNLNIYACGGAGLNVAQNTIDIPTTEGFPNTEITLVDTSSSNVAKDLAKENFRTLFIDGLKGTGKDRSFALSHCRPEINDYLASNKPGDFNFVVFSLAGGSGSVTGPLIAGNLLGQGLPVICFLIGSTEDGIQTKNTFNTLRTLQNLSKVHKAPLVICYYQNDNEGKIENPRPNYGREEVVNAKVASNMRSVALLVSEYHNGLDRRDIKNWLFYNNVVDVKPMLCELIIAQDNSEIGQFKGTVVSSASLLGHADDLVPDLMQPYSCKGIMKSKLTQGEEKVPNLHFLTTSSFIKNVHNSVKEELDQYEMIQSRLSEGSGFDDDELEDGGDPFVL